MRILVIDNVNFTDYPTGGIMNFYRNMLPAFGNDLLLAGITTDGTGEVGEWEKREMNGCQFDFYTMAHITPASKRLNITRLFHCIISITQKIKISILFYNFFVTFIVLLCKLMYNISTKIGDSIIYNRLNSKAWRFCNEKK